MMHGDYTAVTTIYAELDGFRIAYRRFGSGTGVPLLLCQRFKGTMDHWDPALVDVFATERTVIAFDNIGVGASTGEPSTSIAGMADIAGRLLDHLGVDSADVLGWSMGGTVAQQLALSRPALVRRLILAATGPGGVADAPRAPDKVWQTALKPENDDEDFLYLFFTEDAVGRAAGLASLRRLDTRLLQSKSWVGADAARAQFGALGAWMQGSGAAHPRLGEITIPVFVANGVHDVMVHAYNSYVLSQKLPNAKLVLYPQSGHGFLFQHAAEFGRDVLEFLS